MATGSSVSDEIKEQRSKLKGKTLKEKWSYFWEYYRVPTLIILICAVLGGNLIYSIVTQKDIVFYGLFINGYTEMDTEVYMESFEQYAGIDTDKYEATLETNFSIQEEAGDQYAMANVQKLMAMVAAKSIDCIVSDTPTFRRYADAGYFSDLNQVLTAEQMEQYKDRLFYYDVPEDEQGEIPIGIQAADFPGIRASGAYMAANDALFGFVVNSEHLDTTAQFLEYIQQDSALSSADPQ